MTEERRSGKIYGVLAEFGTPEELAAACRRVREAGYEGWDAHTPFPVHGVETAMGLGRSAVPWFVLGMGLGGAVAGMLLQWWTSAVAYPLVVSGKPFFSWPAFVPIMFECGVLGGALGAVLGFLYLAGLPRPHHPLFDSTRFERVTDDGFFLSIEAADPKFNSEVVVRFLVELGARHVEVIQG